ncbi:MAG: serine hydrolase [Saprospiraceae bacterium]
MKFSVLFIAISLCISGQLQAQNLYFPPLVGDTWEQMSSRDAGYCDSGLASLDSILEAKNSKAFILLKDGKIVHEQYFGSFTQDSLWLWNSAGKTMTAALVGIAQQENLLNVTDATSTYLGTGWTSAPSSKEDLITIWHQLTMTSGLDYNTGDAFCTEPACLLYLADAGSRWSYHNGPYTLLDSVIEVTSGQIINTFFRTRLRNKTGITGLYLRFGYNNVFISSPRSMARFGLLTLNKGIWDTDPILTDTGYIRQMTSTSQNINPSYGYLWWLNGKSSYRLPGSQIDFPGSIAPSAPSDAYAALGKDGQIITVIPSTNEVWIRMGESPDGSGQLVANILFEDISKAIEEARCTSSASTQLSPKPAFSLKTNPVYNQLQLQATDNLKTVEIIDVNGRSIRSVSNNLSLPIDVANLPQGQYTVIGWRADGQGSAKHFIKL